MAPCWKRRLVCFACCPCCSHGATGPAPNPPPAGVGLRTVRRDIDRLRDLGYPVDATPGTAGGYRLGVGAALPPLLLDDEEAVAVAISLHTARPAAWPGWKSARFGR